MNKLFSQKFSDLCLFHPYLISLETDLFKSLELLVQVINEGGTIYVCGNGGSASDSEHIAGELLKGFLLKRPIKNQILNSFIQKLGEDRAKEFSSQLQLGIKCISLIGHNSFSTAYANDMSYEYAVAQKLFVLGESKDVLMAITTSGNSKNILNAVDVARVKNMKVIGLSGMGGGKLANLCDVCLKAPFEHVHRIQEAHLPIYHFMCEFLEAYFFGE